MEKLEEGRVWYLAFGSNMNYSALTVMRQVKPRRAFAVTVPDYVLSFDIRGLAYMEPCWASIIKLKKHGEKSIDSKRGKKMVEGGEEVEKEMSLKGREEDVDKEADRRDVWSRCCPGLPYSGAIPPQLCGVVYDISEDDYRKIVVTEAGFAYDNLSCAYSTIEVDCITIKSSEMHTSTVENQLEGELLCSSKSQNFSEPQKMRARTLMALPRSTSPNLWPNYRYMNLIRNGAKRNNLPLSYQNHLESLCFYETLTWRKFILGFIYIVPFIIVWMLMKLFILPWGKRMGRQPYFVAKIFDAMMRTNQWGEAHLNGFIGSGWRTDDGQPRNTKEKRKKL
eukprot:TRINITY_DN3085_c0_g5_i1.p1 TRINITY_DN3085_c0_g5~~TRINITY_DN3085_c0_g5_i1.p1  ORF type:complete len:337 (-),score=71.59 TRINITY_DN3085_c0_g5_i1:26-1036(-)